MIELRQVYVKEIILKLRVFSELLMRVFYTKKLQNKFWSKQYVCRIKELNLTRLTQKILEMTFKNNLLEKFLLSDATPQPNFTPRSAYQKK